MITWCYGRSNTSECTFTCSDNGNSGYFFSFKMFFYFWIFTFCFIIYFSFWGVDVFFFWYYWSFCLWYKKVIAYSTCSQLGYMFVSAGFLDMMFLFFIYLIMLFLKLYYFWVLVLLYIVPRWTRYKKNGCSY